MGCDPPVEKRCSTVFTWHFSLAIEQGSWDEGLSWVLLFSNCQRLQTLSGIFEELMESLTKCQSSQVLALRCPFPARAGWWIQKLSHPHSYISNKLAPPPAPSSPRTTFSALIFIITSSASAASCTHYKPAYRFLRIHFHSLACREVVTKDARAFLESRAFCDGLSCGFVLTSSRCTVNIDRKLTCN